MYRGPDRQGGRPELVGELEARATAGSPTRSTRRSPRWRPQRLIRDLAAEFPVLRREIDGHPVTYLDSAATSQTPQVVIDAMTRYYTNHRASIHRGVYPLAVEATDLYEGARAADRRLAAARPPRRRSSPPTRPRRSTWSPTPGAARTSSAATSIVLTEMEHHSNIVPVAAAVPGARRRARVRAGARRRPARPRSARPAARARAQAGRVVPRLERARHDQPGRRDRRAAPTPPARSSLDRRQPRRCRRSRVDLPAIDADFYAWTGHKAYGPTGIGVLHGRRELLEEMPPFIGGGHMISTVDATSSTWTELPRKFEAGTSQIAEAIGLGAAVDWIAGDRDGRDPRPRARRSPS